MTLAIKDPGTERLARELAMLTGLSVEAAVTAAIEEKLEAERHRRGKPIDREMLRQIVQRIAERPFVDDRAADEILGYDESGLPG